MITALDTNIIVALWTADAKISTAVQNALDVAQSRGRLVVSAPVVAELMACPATTESSLNDFLRRTSIAVEWEMEEAIWRLAGRTFRSFAERRTKQREPGPRRILADFLIGAHAAHRGYHLLTLDERHYRVAFSNLAVIIV